MLVTDVSGFGLTLILPEGNETHPVAALVKVKLTRPEAKPVTTPEEVILATDKLDEVHVPPDVGCKVVVCPIQIVLFPVMDMVGLGFTVTGTVGEEGQPEMAEVKIKVAVPVLIPVTTPLLFTVATAGF